VLDGGPFVAFLGELHQVRPHIGERAQHPAVEIDRWLSRRDQSGLGMG
jgi:hypothetical protein